MNAANIISLLRLLAAPLTVWLLLSAQWQLALWLVLGAGISDAVDGFLAKRFGMQSELGAFLDPLADKALLVGIYVSLSVAGHLPSWLAILVVSRDLLIVGGVLLSFFLTIDLAIKPMLVSKLNTVLQILLALAVLADLGWTALPLEAILALTYAVGATTVLSGAAYVVQWSRRQSSA